MNKKVYGIVIGIFLIGTGFFLIFKPKANLNMKKLIFPTGGTISGSIDSKETSNSVIGLDAKKGDKLRFEYSSSIKEGNLNINLYSYKKVVESFEVNVKGKKEIIIDEDENLTLWAEYEDFKGDFKVEVYK